MALPGAQLGLPEVKLGLMPGSGGTQRVPRLAGVSAALDMVLTGRSVCVEEAQALGLIDLRVESTGDAQVLDAWRRHRVERASQSAGAFALNAVSSSTLPPSSPPCEWRTLWPRTSQRSNFGDRSAALVLLNEARTQAMAARDSRDARLMIVDAIRAALHLPFDAGMRLERRSFLSLVSNADSRGRIHAFLAERGAAKRTGVDAAPMIAFAMQHAGVIGGGTMGVGIAIACMNAGLQVSLIERDRAACERAQARIGAHYAQQVAAGRLEAHVASKKTALLSVSDDYVCVAESDLVIEAVFEDFDAKVGALRQAEAVCKPAAVLATNTSYLDINALALTLDTPSRLIGLHFFSPAHVMRLLEVVVGDHADERAVAYAFALAKKLGKTPVRAGVCDGFIGNRILARCRQVANAIVAAGASPYEVDEAIRQFGFAMGPYEVMDLAGGDIAWATRKRRALARAVTGSNEPSPASLAVADRLCERGWFGQKTGRGFYRYASGSRRGEKDPDVLLIVDEERARAGIIPRVFDADEIIRRYMAAMINESAAILEESIALTALDVDTVLLAGYGFPKSRGGPLHYANERGLEAILCDILTFSASDSLSWVPSPLLVRLVERGGHFGEGSDK
jgi:3-hydroxyacyl-CoA dehydrogenase